MILGELVRIVMRLGRRDTLLPFGPQNLEQSRDLAVLCAVSVGRRAGANARVTSVIVKLHQRRTSARVSMLSAIHGCNVRCSSDASNARAAVSTAGIPPGGERPNESAGISAVS